jgi:hypothetical protein
MKLPIQWHQLILLMEDITRVRLAVKRLIEINRRRFASYRSAARQFTTLELKSLFMNFALQSVRFRKDLYQWIDEHEATSDQRKSDSPSTAGFNERDFSFSSFVSLEEEVLRTYRTVLATSFLPFEALKQIENQVKEIESARRVFEVIRGGLSRQLNAA